jgi:hypothetical protein
MRRLVLLVVLAFATPVAAESEPAARTENPDAKLDWKGPSGFWTNPRPAKGGAYRWRMMAIGGVVLLITGYAVWRLIKNSRK